MLSPLSSFLTSSRSLNQLQEFEVLYSSQETQLHTKTVVVISNQV